MKMIKKISIIIMSFIVFSVKGQMVEKGIINIGKNYIFDSKILNESREIQIYTPTSYQDSTSKKYPVLYVIDGQDYYNSVVSFQKMLLKREFFPEFIIVGIKTDMRKRRTLLGRNSNKFIDFLKSELITYIDANYRTSKEKERIFFGWEIAGGIGIDILSKTPNLFSGYILASPSNLWDFRLNNLEEKLKTIKEKEEPFLLITAAPDEKWLNENKQLRSFFNKNRKGKLNWRYSTLDREEHHSTPFKTINEGIIDYFHNYKPITFRTLKLFDEFGGLEGLKTFYAKRGERYGISSEINESTKMFVLYNAVMENNYEQFLHYEKAFEGHIEKSSNASWFHRYAAFYLKHNNTKEALYFYNYGLNKLGESKLLYRGIGDVYAKMKKKGKAKKAYEMALKIDPKYKQALEGLKKL